MTSTKAKLEFTHAMAKHTSATVRQCEALMRYAGTLRQIAEQSTGTISPGQIKLLDKRDRIRERVLNIIERLNADLDSLAYFVNILNDPAAAIIKIRVSDGGEICVPS